jgi:thiol-disulfide isomerase/thioredoxin
MSANIPLAALPPTYRKALKTWRPVILYFANEHCPACEWAGPIFARLPSHTDIAPIFTCSRPAKLRVIRW